MTVHDITEKEGDVHGGKITKFVNCRLVRNHQLVTDQLWIRDGKVIDPEPVFYDQHNPGDVTIDCKGVIIAPGFIDIQINGGFGYDFSDPSIDTAVALDVVSRGILAHGVTSFCPTVVTQSPAAYKYILPKLKRSIGIDGATVIGTHLEGPFICMEKKGAHTPKLVNNKVKSMDDIMDTYGSLDDVSIITLAPELDTTDTVIRDLVQKGIIVSMGHTDATLSIGERAVSSGANLITHLFNAMPAFHHRDPGLIGLLTSNQINRPLFYGIIADGIHTHYSAVKIAYSSNPQGLVLVTDAMSALGLSAGKKHKISDQFVEIRDNKAFIDGTNTLAGSIASMDQCVQNLRSFTKCTIVEAIEGATLHPAQVLQIDKSKGSLNFGADADFVFLNDDLKVLRTFINGRCVYQSPEWTL